MSKFYVRMQCEISAPSRKQLEARIRTERAAAILNDAPKVSIEISDKAYGFGIPALGSKTMFWMILITGLFLSARSISKYMPQTFAASPAYEKPAGVVSFVNSEQGYGLCYDPSLFTLSSPSGDFDAAGPDVSASVKVQPLQANSVMAVASISARIAAYKVETPDMVVTTERSALDYFVMSGVSRSVDFREVTLQEGDRTKTLFIRYKHQDAAKYQGPAHYMSECFFQNSSHGVRSTAPTAEHHP